MKRDSRIVYSTTDGDLRKARDPKLKERRADGKRVEVRREIAGRRGKAVTTVSGVPVDDAGLKALAAAAVRGGGVHVNGVAVKPSREVGPGDRLEITIGPFRRTVIVRGAVE